MKRVGIIGAGPAGVTAAYELSKVGVEADLFEGAQSVGGMSKTIELWGQRVDLGPHRFFSSDARVNKVWLDVAEGEYEMVNRLTRILYNNKFYDYPLKPLNVLSNLEFFKIVACFFSYFKAVIVSSKLTENSTFEDWVVSKFGRKLFSMFFKTYSEKLWGISCGDLDADFAVQRIKKFSLFEALLNACHLGGGQHQTLVDCFAYPYGGSGDIYEKMTKQCCLNGGHIFLNTPVKRVLVESGRVRGIELKNGKVCCYDHVISSMPITELVKSMPEVPEDVISNLRALRFRNTILVYLKIEGNGLFEDNWLYVHSKDLETGRITNFRNWTQQVYGESDDTILALEYWCNSDDPRWRNDDESIIQLAQNDIEASGLLKGHRILDGKVIRLEKSYPVYRCGYKEHMAVVREYLQGIKGLSVIGRAGAFKYNNQDHSILMGILAASNITESGNYDLWSVNTDYEYQEKANITKAGLVKIC